MTGDEIRSAFLRFFEEKDHKVIPSSSLIPHGDPTLLLTTAGMVQFKPYFLGLETPPAPRLASCQKCFRTTDVEAVGDSKHLTFFEMLGNFSIGDYFKQEAIRWAWEFITERMKLPPERLWITVYKDDDESLQIWKQKIGIPPNRILKLGDKDNFWGPAGNSGPCGPCSEIHYDFGEEYGCKKPDCSPACDCGRFVEIWNLVFTQYNQDEKGNRAPLPKPNIDTGMGLERITAVMQGKTTVYDTDFFTPLIQKVARLANYKYGTDSAADNATRIIAEHSRGIAFLIADGVLPANEGRGYVLRRLLRRASLFGRRIGLDKPFLKETARTTIEKMGHIYPELLKQQDFIFRVIEREETRFSETLSTGLQLLDEIMDEAAGRGKREIAGKRAFELYDTYGFPIELTAEIAAEHNFSLDRAGFEAEMEKQRERARASHKFDGAPKVAVLDTQLKMEPTSFVGYEQLETGTEIAGILVDGKPTDSIQKGQEAGVILAATPFYGEMGGQVGDTGEIRGPNGRFQVTSTIHLTADIIIHQGKMLEGSLRTGEQVIAEIDAARRHDIARNHTATHLLQLALRHVLGEHVQQRGSMVAPDRLRFDFTHLAALTAGEIQEVQKIINERIRQNLAVYAEDTPYKKAVDEGVIALFTEKYGDVVRVLRIGEPVISAELCGGTHVNWTGEIGYFHIISESSIGTGLRRIEAVTGRGAEEFIEKQIAQLQEIARTLGASLEDASEKVSGTLNALETAQKQLQAVERRQSLARAESLLSQVEEIKGIKVLAASVPSSSIETLREMSDLLKDRLKSAIIVLGSVYEDKPVFLAAITPDLVEKGYNAGKLIREVAKVTGGGGGGKPNMAQAGGKDKDKLDEALSLVKSLI